MDRPMLGSVPPPPTHLLYITAPDYQRAPAEPGSDLSTEVSDQRPASKKRRTNEIVISAPEDSHPVTFNATPGAMSGSMTTPDDEDRVVLGSGRVVSKRAMDAMLDVIAAKGSGEESIRTWLNSITEGSPSAHGLDPNTVRTVPHPRFSPFSPQGSEPPPSVHSQQLLQQPVVQFRQGSQQPSVRSSQGSQASVRSSQQPSGQGSPASVRSSQQPSQPGSRHSNVVSGKGSQQSSSFSREGSQYALPLSRSSVRPRSSVVKQAAARLTQRLTGRAPPAPLFTSSSASGAPLQQSDGAQLYSLQAQGDSSEGETEVEDVLSGKAQGPPKIVTGDSTSEAPVDEDQEMHAATDSAERQQQQDPDNSNTGDAMEEIRSSIERQERRDLGDADQPSSGGAPPSPSATARAPKTPTRPEILMATPVGNEAEGLALSGINNMSKELKKHVTEGINAVEKSVKTLDANLSQRVTRLEKALDPRGSNRSARRSKGATAPASSTSNTSAVTDDEASKVFNLKARTRQLSVAVDGERQVLLRDVRVHLGKIFKVQGMDVFGAAEDLDLVHQIQADTEATYTDTFGRHIQNIAQIVYDAPIPPALSGHRIDIDYDAGPKGSAYNQFMARLFLADFHKVPKHEAYDADDVVEAFLGRIKNLKAGLTRGVEMTEEAEELGQPIEVLQRQVKDLHLHAARRRRLWDRRFFAAERLPKEADPQGYIRLFVQQLGWDGMSDDEDESVRSRTGKLMKQRVVQVPAWREPLLRPLLTDLDDIYNMVHGRDGIESKSNRGQLPEIRDYYDNNDMDWNARAVPRLPRCAYRKEWLTAMGEFYVKSSVQPYDGEDFQIPKGFRDYCIKVTKVWEDRHRGRTYRRNPVPLSTGPSTSRHANASRGANLPQNTPATVSGTQAAPGVSAQTSAQQSRGVYGPGDNKGKRKADD